MKKYESRAKQLVHTVIDEYIPEFERVNQGLVTRYGTLLEQ